ncbi:MAG: hypothetical protein ACYC3X_00950 [Pirellulaceae bacterium]
MIVRMSECKYKTDRIRQLPTVRASAALGVLLVISLWIRPAHGQVDYELPPIDYLHAAVHDPVAQLQSRLERGEVQLTFTDGTGYLASVLQALAVPVSSQTLVFSKTSFQQAKISPRRPRALYFNDHVYVGWVQQGDVMEFSAVDPQLGAIFYTLEQQPAAKPRFVRQTQNCLVCHGSSHTEGVPGNFVRSIFPDRLGQPVLSAGTFRTDYTSPLRERWGGWYVTGTHGNQRHMGNVVLKTGSDPSALDVEAGANVVELADRVDVTPYLAPHSDIVALMVLEHQVTVHNRLTAAHFSAQITARDAQIINEALGRDAGLESDSTRRRLAAAAEKVLDVLLFVDEQALTAPIRGTSSFATEFQQRGPVDAHGRSLRELDLQTRLFRYPCSYLIYSEAFDALPAPLRDRVFRRLWEVLTDADSAAKFRHLSSAARRDILAILRSTKPGLPDYWQAPAAP